MCEFLSMYNIHFRGRSRRGVMLLSCGSFEIYSAKGMAFSEPNSSEMSDGFFLGVR